MDFFSIQRAHMQFLSNKLYQSHVTKKIHDIIELSKSEDILSYIQCQLYASDFEYFETQLLDSLKSTIKPSLYNVIVRNLNSIGLLPSVSLEMNNNDPIKDYIGNRNLLIIGPSSLAENIDGFDENQVVKVSLSCLPVNGANISYVSSQFYKENKIELENMLENGSLAFLIINGSPKNFMSSKYYGVKLFGISPFVLTKTSPLLGLNRTLYDLLSRGVKNIIIRNVDWYTANPLHIKSYPTKLSDVDDYLSSLNIHDLATNFLIAKRIYSNHTINCTEYYSSLMDSTLKDYLYLVSLNFKQCSQVKL
jgi:hypothetical protein